MVTSPSSSNDNAALFCEVIETLENASLGLHLFGEKGVGKEAIVRLLYARSAYRGYPFIKVNCPVLSTNAGNDRAPCIKETASHPANSSFSLFRLLHQGVLYFHAVDALGLKLQERLLALIQRKFVSSRSASEASVKGMLIFSTSTRSLESCVADGTFNPVLCELLGGISIHIPPLRHSPERIGPLIDLFLQRFSNRDGRDRLASPSVDHLATLSGYHWPGNLRELQMLVRRALRFNNWEAAINLLGDRRNHLEDGGAVSLTPDGIALMPDFEITQGRMLEHLSERIPPDEVGLMDLVMYDQVIANNK